MGFWNKLFKNKSNNNPSYEKWESGKSLNYKKKEHDEHGTTPYGFSSQSPHSYDWDKKERKDASKHIDDPHGDGR